MERRRVRWWRESRGDELQRSCSPVENGKYDEGLLRRAGRQHAAPPSPTAHLTEPLLSKVTKPAAIKPPRASRFAATRLTRSIFTIWLLTLTIWLSTGKVRCGASLGQVAGPVSRIAASFVPRGSQREAWLQPLRKTPLSVKRELYRREPMRPQRAKPQARGQSVPWPHSIP
jgi:hypothetical protein